MSLSPKFLTMVSRVNTSGQISALPQTSMIIIQGKAMRPSG